MNSTYLKIFNRLELRNQEKSVKKCSQILTTMSVSILGEMLTDTKEVNGWTDAGADFYVRWTHACAVQVLLGHCLTNGLQ